MKHCHQFELRILEADERDRPEVEAHLAGCDGCRQFVSALAEVDLGLTTALAAAVLLPPIAVRLPPERPPFWPELLDLAGWASVIAVTLLAAVVLAPSGMQEVALWFAFGAAVVSGSVYVGLRGWREIG